MLVIGSSQAKGDGVKAMYMITNGGVSYDRAFVSGRGGTMIQSILIFHQ